MSTVLVEMRGSVVNGTDCGSLEAAHAEVSRLLRARGGADPARHASLPLLELFEAQLAETASGGLQLLAADPLGQWVWVSEHADAGSARAALVRLVREHGKTLAVARFDEALTRLRAPRARPAGPAEGVADDRGRRGR